MCLGGEFSSVDSLANCSPVRPNDWPAEQPDPMQICRRCSHKVSFSPETQSQHEK